MAERDNKGRFRRATVPGKGTRIYSGSLHCVRLFTSV